MDPALWSQLPLEVLSLIIQNTADSETRKTWRDATKHSARLQHDAMQTTYSTFAICEKRLLRAPKMSRRYDWYTYSADDEASECTLSEAQRPKNQLVLELRRCGYQSLAPYVLRLNLQFYFASSDRRTYLVRSEDVRHTLDTILPAAKALQEIDHSGVLYQEDLDGILEVKSLRVLRVRQSWNETPCMCSEGRTSRPRALWLLDWSRLFHLHALKTLSVSQLHAFEAVGLAKALKKLRSLESLRVEIAKTDVRAIDALSDDGDDLPFKTFIDALYHREEKDASEELGFPSSLKALALSNVHYYGHLNISRLPKNLHTPLPNLTTLCLDLFDSEEITNLLAFLNPHSLTHLLVSAYPKPQMIRRGSKYKACYRCETFSSLLGQNSDTLREITLLDAWQNICEDGGETEPPWVSLMPLQQLYLSKPSQRSGPRLYPRPMTSETLAWRLHGGLQWGESDCSFWGQGVRHLRVDQLDLAKLKISTIDQAADGFRQLKIIVLRSLPEQIYYEPSAMVSRATRHPYVQTGKSVLRSTPYPHIPFGPDLPQDMDALREGRMAKEIAAQNLPSLRVIVVGEYKFWLQRLAEENDHKNRSPKVWFLRHALEDPGQEAVIGQVMDRDDWDFVADREDCLPEKAPKEQVRRANRLIYRPGVERVDR